MQLSGVFALLFILICTIGNSQDLSCSEADSIFRAASREDNLQIRKQSFQTLLDELPTGCMMNRAKCLIQLGDLNTSQGKLKEALSMLLQAESLAKELGDSLLIARSSVYLGALFDRSADFASAKQYHRLALKIFEGMQDSTRLTSTLINLGNAYKNAGQLDSALLFLDSGTDLAIQLDHPYKAIIAQQLANAYAKASKNEKAEEIYKWCLNINASTGNDLFMANLLMDYSYLQAEEAPDTAMVLASKAATLYLSVGDSIGYGSSIYSKGLILLAQGSYQDALSTIQRANDIFSLTTSVRHRLISNAALADLYLKTGRLADALSKSSEGIKYSNQFDDPDLSLLQELHVTKVLALQGLGKRDLVSQGLVALDSVRNAYSDQILQRAADKGKLLLEKQKLELQHEKAEKMLLQAQAEERSKNFQLLIAAGMAVCFILATSFLIVLIRQQKIMVESVLKAKEEALKQERARMTSELHNNVSTSIASARNIINIVNQENDRSSDTFRNLNGAEAALDTAADRLTQITEDIVSGRLQMTFAEAIQDYYNQLQKGLDNNIPLTITGDLGNVGTQKISTLYQIVQGLLLNAWKHSQASEVFVILERDEKDIRVIVRDDGTGIAGYPNDWKKGNGLQLVDQLSKTIGASCQLRSSAESGTEVTVIVSV